MGVCSVFYSFCSLLGLRKSRRRGAEGEEEEERRRCDGGENERMRWSCRRSHHAGPPPRLIMTRLSKYRRRLSSLKHLQLGKIGKLITVNALENSSLCDSVVRAEVGGEVCGA